MVVSCPKCHLDHEYKSGKNHYICSCGAEFIVDSAGNVHLLDGGSSNLTPQVQNWDALSQNSLPETALSQSERLSILKYRQLNSLYYSSLFLIQWGWLGVIAFFFTFFRLNSLPWWISITSLVMIANSTYILLCCRSDAARTVIFIGALEFLTGVAGAAAYFIAMQPKDMPLIGSLVVIGIGAILPLFIGINLLLASRRKMLWGKDRFTHEQIKTARKWKKGKIGFTDSQLPAANINREVSTPEKIAVAIEYAMLIINAFLLVYTNIKPINNVSQTAVVASSPAAVKNNAQQLRKAADQGDAQAQYNLGVCYEKGFGVQKDLEQAVYWYRKAAEQGHADAQYNLGVSYAEGQGVSQDYKQAVYWFSKAAEQGMKEAQYNLGVSYAEGQGVPQSYEEAVKWYRKAAEQGLKEAQYNLALCYGNGLGVPQSDEEGIKWLRKAAAQGDALAQEALKKLGK